MLSWRIIFSRGSCLPRRNVLNPARAFHNPPSLGQYRAPGLLPMVWFRSDGTPRSKLKGALFGTLGLVSALTVYSFADLVEEYDTANFLLLFLVYAQRVDAHYEQQDFSSYQSTRKYFYELCCALPDAPQTVIDEFFEAIDEVVHVSSQDIADEIHTLMAQFLQETHAQIQNMERDGAMRTSNDVLHALYDTITLISRVHGEVHGGDDGEFAFSTILRQNKSKDPSQRGTDYEAIG